MMQTVPKTWATVALGEIADVRLGKMLDAKRTAGAQLPYLRNINVRWGTIDTSDLLTMAFEEHELERYGIKQGDVLVCEGGEPGRAAVWSHGDTGLKFQKALHRVRLKGGIESRFLVCHLWHDAGNGTLARSFTGTTIHHLTGESLDAYSVRLPPIDEQVRICDSLDSYNSRVDETVMLLERVRRNVKRYRASVLRAAVEGRLVPTEAELARAEKRDYEPASKLLQRILAERRQRWDSDGRRGKYEEPEPPDTKNLPELPKGWCWASMGQLGAVSGGLTKNAKRDELPRRLPYLRVANVYANELRLDDVEEIGVADTEIERTLLRRGDLLVVEGNGSLDQVGRVALWDGSISPCLHQNHLIKVRLNDIELASWALNWLLSPGGRVEVQRVASSTSGLHTLSISKVARLPVPLCPTLEQERIRLEVDRLITLAASMQVNASGAIQRAARLRQSILKWAFEGKLVDQDPNDEPASALLARVRAERGEAEAQGLEAKRPRSPRRARS
jgi:type I restriction enzyme S subunit